ncbi:hypothetical protein LTR36_007480 [Oleoguttula mirabilis]|uniref:Uncharacterized protein n=1 Tax=Oleoguttula mirabilis TaxID=1507867 RepID=A0AAV9JU23_9PEZI|nr:hypothetical protein LTR36_007480 [Oleoguttula mirabilis]
MQLIGPFTVLALALASASAALTMPPENMSPEQRSWISAMEHPATFATSYTKPTQTHSGDIAAATAAPTPTVALSSGTPKILSPLDHRNDPAPPLNAKNANSPFFIPHMAKRADYSLAVVAEDLANELVPGTAHNIVHEAKATLADGKAIADNTAADVLAPATQMAHDVADDAKAMKAVIPGPANATLADGNAVIENTAADALVPATQIVDDVTADGKAMQAVALGPTMDAVVGQVTDDAEAMGPEAVVAAKAAITLFHDRVRGIEAAYAA